jgi:NAD(P)-dependent dehydrogenase (short-subunit alcohol dehydrogenase family)
MTNNVWFITGAGRGMGLDITKAALAADHKVVATGRNTDKVTQAVGESANLLVVKLDVANPANAESAVKAVIDRFGRIDVLATMQQVFMQAILRRSRRSRWVSSWTPALSGL